MTAVLPDARAEKRTYPWNIGLAYCGDASKAGTWSGTPASLGNALRGRGASVVALKAQAAPAVETLLAHTLTLLRVPRTPGDTLIERARLSRRIALYTGQRMSPFRSHGLRGEIARALPLDAVVQIQTNYSVPHGLPIVTYEDMTVAQAVDLPYAEWQALTKRERRAGIERQKRAYEQAVACCFATQWAADSAAADYGVPREKTHVIGVGRNHSPRPVPRDWSTPRYLFVASDWPMKNGDAVVGAFARLQREIPEARLDLVGIHPPIDSPGVHGHGWLSLGDPADRAKLDELFETSTCFVMPTLCEAAGIAYAEAGAAGVPSIGTSVGGAAEVIGDGGCVVDPRDHDALYAAMDHFADGNTARAAGSRAQAHAEWFTWPNVASRLLAALEPHLAPSRRA